MNLEGLFTALITPFHVDGSLDLEGLAKNVDFQVASGVQGVVVLGTTGEAPTLTKEESELCVKTVVARAKGKTKVIVGTGGYSTEATIEHTNKAAKLGADAALIIAPYYNKPSQEGLYLHFEALSKATSLPLIVYNNPGRCSVNITPETLRRIATLPRVIGVKECCENFVHVMDVLEQVSFPNPNFKVVSGTDIIAYILLSLGGHGIISVASNMIPEEMTRLVKLAREGKLEEARKLHYEIYPFLQASCIETNPIPIKAMMNMQGLPSGACRLPLTPLQKKNEAAVQQCLDTFFATV